VCITTKDVFAWGSNEYGQLGHGDNAPDVCSRPFPIKVLHDVMVTQVRPAGPRQNCSGWLEKSVGAAAWAVAVHSARCLLPGLGTSLGCGVDGSSVNNMPQGLSCLNLQPTLLVLCVLVLQVVCGRLHTICVTAQSQVYAWGHNSAGQLGLSDRRDR
jgi:alpha-tubulin suppressor-like RCC1 family protein